MYASFPIQEEKNPRNTWHQNWVNKIRYMGLVETYCIQAFITTVFRNHTKITTKHKKTLYSPGQIWGLTAEYELTAKIISDLDKASKT